MQVSQGRTQHQAGLCGQRRLEQQLRQRCWPLALVQRCLSLQLRLWQ